MRLVATLEAGRLDFLDAVGELSEEAAGAAPEKGAWSVIDCVEHVAVVEERYLRLISNGTEPPPRRNSRNEMRLSLLMRSRAAKVHSPEPVRPSGRFRSLSAALAEFQTVRDRSVRFAAERGEALYSIGARHPFFGNLNGVEWFQLIDGHARRHADQIRETREVLSSSRNHRMKPTRRKTAVFKRDTPDLPVELASPEAPDALFSDPASVALQELRLARVERRNQQLDAFRIEGCVLEESQFEDSVFGSAVWKDVRLENCDLANLRAHRLTLVRVELIDCRLTGLAATALAAQDVLIRNADLRYARFQEGSFRACEFENCNWEEADLQRAELSGCVFRSCNLARADLHGARLHDTDLRGSEVEGMAVGMNDLRGAIVDPAQAMVFAKVLGLQIR